MLRALQEHAHGAGQGTLEEWLLYVAGLVAVGAMAYVYFRHIRPRRKA
ncbi:MAG: hypothetical protein QOD77_2144 [Thermoplasmata archaeon]|nr:hypothetical protein [Thermoplasmata archaeon]